ncbi:MAG: DHH family phosphoesterase [Desulfurellaceae bacterium]|nr:DHH family phosphoesterase [Desulfurellaceae bacterium]
MTDKVFVIGRRNPDTDGIASVIGYAYLKKKITREDKYVPVTAGLLEVRTMKILDFVLIKYPPLMEDLNLHVSDIMTKRVIVAPLGAPVVEVFKIMVKEDIRVVPVVDNEDKFFGLVGFIDIAKKSISTVVPDVFRRVKTSIELMSRSVSGDVVNSVDGDEEFISNITVVATSAERFCSAIDTFDARGVVAVVGDREDVQRVAIEKKVRCLVIFDGYELSEELLKLAKKNEVSVICSPYGACTTVGLIEWSAPVYVIANKGESTTRQGEKVDDIRERMLTSPNRALPVIDEKTGKVLGVVTRTDLAKYVAKRVILIDHSDTLNAPEGIFSCVIEEIIDHHRFGDIRLKEVARIRTEPWGSTSAIVADEYMRHDIKPERKIAFLLAAGIVINTDFFEKVTTTKKDKEMFEWLIDVGGEDKESFISHIKNL